MPELHSCLIIFTIEVTLAGVVFYQENVLIQSSAVNFVRTVSEPGIPGSIGFPDPENRGPKYPVFCTP